MMRQGGMIPGVHFGEVGEEPVDWRKSVDDQDLDDDEELDETPKDVVGILGFDPKAEFLDQESDVKMENKAPSQEKKAAPAQPKKGHRTRVQDWQKWMAVASKKGFGDAYFALDSVMPHEPHQLLAYSHAAEALGLKRTAAVALKKYEARKGDMAKEAEHETFRQEALGGRNEHLDMLFGNNG